MKQSRVMVLVASGLCIGATAAQAQSSVTLYGTLDAGLTYVSNEGGHQNYRMDSGILHGNRWGVKGAEDLGGGLSTVFVLEGGYNLGTGKANQGGAEFGRQAYVGLQGAFGSIRLGNQYDMIADYACDYNVSFAASGYGVHQGDFDRMSCTRLSNSVKYTSPVMGGFQAGAVYSFSNVAGNFHDGSAFEVGGRYAYGPIKFALTYATLAKPTYDPYSRIGTFSFLGQTTATQASNGTVTDVATSMTIDSTRIIAAGGSYALGNWTFEGNYTNTSFNNKGVTAAMQVFEAGAQYKLTPATTLVGGYQHTTFEGHAWNQVSAGVLYAFSKSTICYVSTDYLKASSGVNAVIGYSFAPSLSSTQADVRVGIYHTF